MIEDNGNSIMLNRNKMDDISNRVVSLKNNVYPMISIFGLFLQ